MQPADAGQSLRSSRRRVQKHSAVVLNADRLKKFSSSNLDETGILEDSFILQQEQNQSLATVATATTVESHSNLLINFRIKVDEKESVKIIERWWQCMLSKRRWRYTQGGKWKIGIADRVFSFILGYRVRRLLSLNDCQKLVLAEKDVRKVISELLLPYARSTVLAGEKQHSLPDEETISRKSMVLVTTWLLNLQELSKSHSLLSGPDQQLIKSLIKQLLLERSKVYKYIFDRACYYSFPTPGYWHLSYHVPTSNRASIVVKKSSRSTPTRLNASDILSHGENISAINGTPVRSDRKPIHIEETPPHVKQALQQNDAEQHRSQRNKLLPFKFLPQHNNNHAQNHESVLSVSNFGANRSLFHVDDDPSSVQQSTEVGESEELIVLKRPSTAPNNGVTVATVQTKKPIARPSTTATGRSNSAGTAPSSSASNVVKKRAHDGGHIQLEIISGEKIMPAKKTGNKDGSIIPDRKPSIKVTFYMPTSAAIANQSVVASSTNNIANSSGLNSMKKIYQIARDFDKTTLNPVWNSHFTITLPFSKIVLKQFAEKIITSATLDNHTHKLTITDQEYDSLVKALLNSWLSGVIEIEVYDNERFNEDIFLGKVTLLITSFMPLIRKFDQLEMKGRYQLEKNKPNNRVSGSIQLHAFLHVPEKAHLEEQILQLYGNNIPPNLGSFTNSTIQKVPAQHQAARQPSSSSAQPSFVSHSNSNDALQESIQSINRMSKSLSRRISAVQQNAHGNLHPITHANSNHSPEESKHNRPSSRGTPIESNKIQQTTPPSDHSIEATNKAKLIQGEEYEPEEVDELEQSDILNQGVYLSNFMKTIQQQYTPDRKTRQSNGTERETNNRQNFGNSPTAPEDFPDPQLEESENIRIPVVQPNGIQYSSIQQSMNVSNRSPEDMRSSNRALVSASSQQHPQRSLDKIRNNVSVSSIVNKETALESSKTRKNFLSDMIKQLDDLSIMQQNAGEVVDHISKKLEAKKAAVLESKDKPTLKSKSVAVTPKEMENIHQSPENRVSNIGAQSVPSVEKIERSKASTPVHQPLPSTPAEKTEQSYPKGFNRHRHAYQHHRVPQPPPAPSPSSNQKSMSTPEPHPKQMEVEDIDDIPTSAENSGIQDEEVEEHDDEEVDSESIQQSLDNTARKLEDLDFPQFQDSENEEVTSSYRRKNSPKVVYAQLNLIAEDEPNDDNDDEVDPDQEGIEAEHDYSVEEDDFVDDEDDESYPLEDPEEVYEPVEDDEYDDADFEPRHSYQEHDNNHDNVSHRPNQPYVSVDFLPPLSEGDEVTDSVDNQKHVDSSQSSHLNFTKKIQYNKIIESDDERHSTEGRNTKANSKFFSPVTEADRPSSSGGSGSRSRSFHRLKQLESDSDSTTSSIEIPTSNIRDRSVIAKANHEPIRVHSPANQYMYHDRSSPNQELRHNIIKAKSPIVSPGRRLILENGSASSTPGSSNRKLKSSNVEQVHKVVKRVLELDHMEL